MDFLHYFDLFDILDLDDEERPRKRKAYKTRFDPFSLEEDELKGKYRFTKRYVKELVELIREDIEQTKKGGGLSVELQVCTALRARQEVQDNAADIHGLSQQSITVNKEEAYNRSHILTRNTIERWFGLWKKRLRCLLPGFTVKLQQVKLYIIALAALHNIAIDMGEEIEDIGVIPETNESILPPVS